MRWSVSWVVWALLMAMLCSGEPAAAAPSDPVRARAEDLVRLINGEAAPESLFTETLLREIPAAQMRALAARIAGAGGRARGVAALEGTGGNAVVELDLERGTLRARLVVEAEPPHRIAGLLFDPVKPRADSMAAVLADMEALPGSVSFEVAKLGEGAPERLFAHQPDRPLAIGSAFKLFVLAETSRQVQSGTRRWSDVVTLDRQSLPSGLLQDWPRAAPLTLHSLAALMISVSDNSAADTLIHRLGRERIEALLPVLGVAAAERNRPFLSTHEAFALKFGADRALLAAYRSGDQGSRRALLPRLSAVPPSSLDPASGGGVPAAIDEAEWFASARDLVRTMDWLRRHGGDDALRILAIAPGTDSTTAQRFAYLGYKGGSEAGVLNMTYLARRTDGAWIAASASWNNPTAPVQTERLATLMMRTLNLAAAD
ncbi:serine hydrolase [Sphingosinicella sp. BN140058]|uniref:serine hydrolase n=1 Tax=Sphingosinicella sp. BN140058 TaxID=1892855 RepID=UPI001011F95F|nr:serine hydrolase [Sphingosinicella sp. BN140058]QAY79589.1 serine hydrolase [Sphingosinicella sp. BN140058]